MLHTKRLQDGTKLSTNHALLLLSTGWSVLDYESLFVFPLLGIGAGKTSVDYKPSAKPILQEQLAAYPEEERVSRDIGIAVAAIGLEQQLKFWQSRDWGILSVATNIGYIQQFAPSAWAFDDPDLPSLEGGPAVNWSGPFVRVSVGIGVGSRL